MRITCVLAATAAVVMAAAGVAFAGQAQADHVPQGIYTYTQGDVVAEWTIYPSCVPTVGDLRDNLELPVACRLHIAPSSINLVNGGDARLTGGRWAFSTVRADAIECSDGGTAPIMENYSFDPVTLTGTRQVANNDVCNNQLPANIATFPFTLAFNRPLPIPVQEYPLYCEPGGLKRCF
ncbi:hypothetical protein [Mycolicibacterium arenosum]|uniref:Secreted protein n=1 Tax=Mycolicibacterium arenosum TaxID=2952157 RepID=A0ABT1MDH8_9MYCO|nr:hypothetical protein [Mycolicibacterium sp. CAU 1645]MCP9276615.1 hypothetical protein [Mycolicibacterium sp. CAU 1645]